MYRLILLLLCCLSGLCHRSAAQILPFVNYSTAQGMVHNRTHTINQDGLGFIWVGTDLGINRYDGRTFKHYACPLAAHYFARYSSRRGKDVLFAIDGVGLALCCGDSVRFILPKKMKPLNISGAAALNDGSFLFNDAEKGLVWMDITGKTKVWALRVQDPSDYFVDMFRDRRGFIWILSSRGLIVFPEQKPENAIRLKHFENNYLNCVREAPDGSIYVACFSGVYRIDPRDRVHLNESHPKKIFAKKQEVTALDFDQKGKVWLTTVYNGAYSYDPASNRLEQYGTDNGLISRNTWSLLCDRENNIWIGTEDGISKLSDLHYRSFDFRGNDFQNVKSGLKWDDSTLLLSNVTGIYKQVGKEIKRLSGVFSAVGYRNHIIDKSPDNRLWVAISEPLRAGNFKVHTVSFRLKGDQLVDSMAVNRMPGGPDEIFGGRGSVQISETRILVSSNKGLKIYENGHFLPVGRPDNSAVTAIAGQGDKCWLLLQNKKLALYQICPTQRNADSFTLKTLQVADSGLLAGRDMNGLFWDSHNRLWCYGVRYGLCVVYLNPDACIKSFQKFPTDFCSSEIINQVHEDVEGHIWLATAGGLDEMSDATGKWSIQKNRFGNLLCGKQIFFVLPMHRNIVAGTTGCSAIIDIKKEAPPQPLVYLSEMRVNERKRPELLSGKPIRLQSGEDNIRFLFTGLYFKDESGLTYSYQLEGLETRWSDPGKDYSVTYSHLSPGNYTFRVRALTPEGVWSKQAATISFVILQPFYTRWWFLLLCTAGVTGLFYLFYRYRMNQVLAIQRIRQSISKDLHDDIGATVSSISILANMAGSELVSDNKRRQFLETIQEESRHVTESLSDIVWSINPKNDSLEIMIARMQRYATELFEARNISYHFDLPEQATANASLPMNKRQHVYLIFKEAINNLVKYAAARNASVSIGITGDTFNMTIRDDGKGFDIDKSTSGNGIINMRKRAQEAGARLSINSIPGSGTSIHFSLPL